MRFYFIMVLMLLSGSVRAFDVEPVLGRLMPVFHNLLIAHEEHSLASADTPELRKAVQWYYAHVREHERYYAHLYALNLLPEAAFIIPGATPRDEFFRLLVKGSSDPAVFRSWLKAGDEERTATVFSTSEQGAHLVLQGGMKLMRRYLALELVENDQAVARFHPCDVQAVDAYSEPFVAWKTGMLPKQDELVLATHSIGLPCPADALGKRPAPESATRPAN